MPVPEPVRIVVIFLLAVAFAVVAWWLCADDEQPYE